MREAPSQKDNLQTTIDQIDTLLAHINVYEKQVGRTLALEQRTIVTPYEERDKGARGDDSLNGYALLLHAFILLKEDHLSQKDRQALEAYIEVIHGLEEESIVLSRIKYKREYEETLKSYDQNKRDTYPYNDTLTKHVDDVYATLEKDGAATICSGMKKHAVFVKLTKETTPQGDTRYYQTTYNSGFESEKTAESGYVKGTLKKEVIVKDEAGIKELIRCHLEKDIRSNKENGYYIVKGTIDSLLGNEVESITVPEQGKGNCSTRSVREMLRHNLGKPLFDTLYEFIAAVETKGVVGLVSDLENRKKELQTRQENAVTTLSGVPTPQYVPMPQSEPVVTIIPSSQAPQPQQPPQPSWPQGIAPGHSPSPLPQPPQWSPAPQQYWQGYSAPTPYTPQPQQALFRQGNGYSAPVPQAPQQWGYPSPMPQQPWQPAPQNGYPSIPPYQPSWGQQYGGHGMYAPAPYIPQPQQPQWSPAPQYTQGYPSPGSYTPPPQTLVQTPYVPHTQPYDQGAQNNAGSSEKKGFHLPKPSAIVHKILHRNQGSNSGTNGNHFQSMVAGRGGNTQHHF